MGKYARKESKTGYYHVMQRGNGKQILFEDQKDFKRYYDKMLESKSRSNCDLVAYCLMSNHTHLLVRAEKLKSLTYMMSMLGISYASYYNLKYDHVGSVFQGRFLSEPINDEQYLLACVRYIHNNPAKAGFGTREEYRWSSYREYLQEACPTKTGKFLCEDCDKGIEKMVDTGIILDMLGSTNAFEEFSKSADDKMFIDNDIDVATCQIGLDIVRKHFGNEFENTLTVKQLCVEERNHIIREMKQAGMNNHQIELVTGVSRDIVRRI